MNKFSATLLSTTIIAGVLCASAQVGPAPAPGPLPPPPRTLPQRELKVPARPDLLLETALKREVERLRDPGSGAFAPDRSRSLIIPRDAVEPEDLAQIEEDLNVMARILEKAASGDEERRKLAMGINIQNSIMGGSSPRNMYLEGYGTVFILNVPFPLLPTSPKAEDLEDKQDTSSEWDAARQELYSGMPPGFAMDLSNLTFLGRLGGAQRYDEDQVEALKDRMVSALRNAAHIRALKPAEEVTIVVNGGGTTQARVASSGTRHNVSVLSQSLSQGAVSRMVLRAKRSDIEAFRQGKLNADQFREKVSIMIS
jgi:intracellular sulfur oxidation DsrE/DsrF family protein